ncbi:hypothetical protein I5U42_05005 [Stenotrophomonas maltophilia]|nr:hypothetical protein [Stenotrophomonas maltophilia]
MKTEWILITANRLAISWAIAAVSAYLCDRFSGNSAATLYSIVMIGFAIVVLVDGFLDVTAAESPRGVPWGAMFSFSINVLSVMAMIALWLATYCKGPGEKVAWVCS